MLELVSPTLVASQSQQSEELLTSTTSNKRSQVDTPHALWSQTARKSECFIQFEKSYLNIISFCSPNSLAILPRTYCQAMYVRFQQKRII